MALKRTKILVTLGPATSDADSIRALVGAGADAFRINFSHGTDEARQASLDLVRQVEEELDRPLAVCADLCGPKIRVGVLEGGEIELRAGSEIVIQRDEIRGSAERISTTCPEIVDFVRPGQPVLLADGRMALEVVEVNPPHELRCRVVVGGTLSNGKGMNLPATSIELSPLTEKDRRDLEWIAARDFDYVALSFVQEASDVEELRELLSRLGSRAPIISKIEKPRALANIDAIIEASDGIMLARGDLGVEMDFPTVPIAQKRVADKCNRAGTPFIVATEMMESMVRSPRPTRAEVSDVANAVFDLTDVVMLSAETAIGKHPVAVVKAMSRTVAAAEELLGERQEAGPGFTSSRVTSKSRPLVAAIAAALRTLSERETIKLAVLLSDTGTTARLISKNRPATDLIALCKNRVVARRACLYYGITPRQVVVPEDSGASHPGKLLELVAREALERGFADQGDRIALVGTFGKATMTNGLIVLTV